METATPEDVARYFLAHPLPWPELRKRAHGSTLEREKFIEWISLIISADYEKIGDFLSKPVAINDWHGYGKNVADILLTSNLR